MVGVTQYRSRPATSTLDARSIRRPRSHITCVSNPVPCNTSIKSHSLDSGPRAPLAPFRAFQKPVPDLPISPPLPLQPVSPRRMSDDTRPKTHFSLAPVSPTSAAMTPVTFLLKTTAERTAGQAFYNNQQHPPMPTNPFETPFDDPTIVKNRVLPSNPFSSPFDDPQSPVGRTAKAF